MDAVVFWAQVLVPIVPHYPKVEPKGGRPPVPLENMLRMYCLQNCYALSDPIAGETLWESDAIRQFAGIEVGDNQNHEETTTFSFWHLLEPKADRGALRRDKRKSA